MGNGKMPRRKDANTGKDWGGTARQWSLKGGRDVEKRAKLIPLEPKDKRVTSEEKAI